MSTRSEQSAGCGVMGFLLSLVVLWMSSGIFHTRSPDAQIAETARRAMEMAEEARADAEAARRASSGIRILALVVGVSAPLAVVYLIYRLREKSDPSLAEVVDALHREGLIDDSNEIPPKHLFNRYKVIERGKRTSGEESDE